MIVSPDDPLAIAPTDAATRQRAIRESLATKSGQLRELHRQADADGTPVAAPPPITDRAGTLQHLIHQAAAAGDTDVVEILNAALADELAAAAPPPGSADQGVRTPPTGPPADLAGQIAAAEETGDWATARRLKLVQATEIAQHAEGVPSAQGEPRP